MRRHDRDQSPIVDAGICRRTAPKIYKDEEPDIQPLAVRWAKLCKSASPFSLEECAKQQGWAGLGLQVSTDVLQPTLTVACELTSATPIAAEIAPALQPSRQVSSSQGNHDFGGVIICS